MSPPPPRLHVESIGASPRDVLVEPATAARSAIAERLGLIELPELACRFRLSRGPADAIMAHGTLDAVVVQLDVDTLEPFAAPIHETFQLRFIPEHRLSNELDPADPVDEVGIVNSMLDLEEAACEQLALALDPYPRRADHPAH